MAILCLEIKVSSLYMYTPGFPYSFAFKTIILGKWKWKLLSPVQLFATPWTVSPWNSPGQNTGVGRFSFSSGSSQPRGGTQVSHIVGRFFTSWATTEVQEYWSG